MSGELTIGGITATVEQIRTAQDALGVSNSLFLNFKETNTRQVRKMVANGIVGGAGGRIMFLGDSAPAGRIASNMDGAQAAAFSKRFADRAAFLGYKTQEKSIFFSRGATAKTGVTAMDPRVVFGSGVTVLDDAVTPGLAGAAIALNNPGDTLTFTPGSAFNKVQVFFQKNTTGQGNFNISFDGGGNVSTVTDNNANGLAAAVSTVPASGSATSVTITRGSGPNFISGLLCFNTLTDEIYVINAGRNGRTLATIAAPPGTTTGDLYNVRASLPVVLSTNLPNLTIINGWYNDYTQGRTKDQIVADLATIITAAKLQGDVMYITYGNLNPASRSQAIQDEYNQACIDVAFAADIPVINIRSQLPPFSVADQMNYFFDSLHYAPIGHAAIGDMVTGIFSQVRRSI